jgi:hypothetical protein
LAEVDRDPAEVGCARSCAAASADSCPVEQGGMVDTALEYAPDYKVLLYGVKSRERPLKGKRLGAVIRGARPRGRGRVRAQSKSRST